MGVHSTGRRKKEAFHEPALCFQLGLQCSKSACRAEVFTGEWSHFNLAAVSPVNPKAQLLRPVIWYSWWLTAKYSPTGIIFHRILQGHRKLREAFTWSHSHLLHTAGWKYFPIRKWRNENGLYIYKCTSTVIYLDYPSLKCQSEQPIIYYFVCGVITNLPDRILGTSSLPLTFCVRVSMWLEAGLAKSKWPAFRQWAHTVFLHLYLKTAPSEKSRRSISPVSTDYWAA